MVKNQTKEIQHLLSIWTIVLKTINQITVLNRTQWMQQEAKIIL